MAKSRMKSETREEQAERLRAQSEAERRGVEAVTEGQLIPARVSPADGDERSAHLMEANQRARLAPTSQDMRAEEPKKAKSGDKKD